MEDIDTIIYAGTFGGNGGNAFLSLFVPCLFLFFSFLSFFPCGRAKHELGVREDFLWESIETGRRFFVIEMVLIYPRKEKRLRMGIYSVIFCFLLF